MKQAKIFFFVVIALLPLILVSCASGWTQSAKGWSGTTVHDGIIYVGTVDGRVMAINSSNQSKQWDFTITPPTTIYTTPIVDGNLVYISTYSGEVYALSIDDGESIWVYPPKGGGYIGAIVGSPVVVNGTMYITSSDSMVYALDTTDGDLKWKSEILDEEGKRHEKLWTSPVVHNGAVYVSTFDGHIYALSLETGELLNWSFASEAGFASSPVIYQDTIFLGSFDRYLYAIKIGSDIPIWKFPREKPAGNWFWASPLVSEGVVYAGCLDGKLYAIDAERGEELWQFESKDQRARPAPIVTSPILVGNMLIVSNEAGNVYVINPETGDGERIENRENEDKPTVDTQIRASLCTYEGLVYIKGENNRLYAVDIDERKIDWDFSLTIEE
jgi:outer membrane protein assembly factor BamB